MLNKFIEALENAEIHEFGLIHMTTEFRDVLVEAMRGEWISVKDRLPEDDRPVLAVKQLKDGRRDMCLARCIPEWEYYDASTRARTKKPYWVCGGNNNIIYWMPLPDMPKEG